MRHNLIIGIKTILRKKRQLVIVEFDNDGFVFLTYPQIRQNTGLEIFEIELLIGSTLRIEFYKLGEKMYNGGICEKEGLIVKEYFFELKRPVAELRLLDSDKLLPFKEINKIFYFHKFNRENVGIITDDGNKTYTTLKLFEYQSNLEKSEQHILIGSYIRPEYFKPGDAFSNGVIVKTNSILKLINLRYSGSIEAMHESFESSVGYYDGNDYYDSDNGSRADGYSSWEDMALQVAYEGDASNLWNTD